MAGEFQVSGQNPAAQFTLKLHRGDGMCLLAMNWKVGTRIELNTQPTSLIYMRCGDIPMFRGQMGRKGNSGPYAPENVECVTKEQKQKAQLVGLASLPPEKRAEIARKAGLARCGEKHWLARPVETPLGTFATVTAAAKAHGIAHSHGSDLAKEERNGWRYLDSPAPLLADD